MTVTRLKPLGNFRASPVRTSTPEPIEIEGGVALLAEAPADPGSPSWPMTVTVNGSPRTRVTTAPAAGQFRVMTQTVIGANGQAANEYLPLLQFHTSDEGLSGTADYWQSGSVLTSQFFTTLVAFLTPLTGYATIDDLPPATSAQTVRGRPGDIAFLTSGEMAYSTGTEWIIFSGSTPSLMGGLSLGQTIAMALDAGYVGPSLDGDHSFDATQAFGADAAYTVGVAADETLDAILGLTMDAVVAHVGAHSYAQAFGMDLDAAWAGPALTGDLTLGQSIAMSLDATYAGDTTAPTVGTLTVTPGSGTACTFSVTATDAVGVVKWLLVEGASDPGAADPGQTGATSVASTTSLSLTSQAFTSSASSTGTRYFRLHAWDAAGNHGVSAVASATVTIAAASNQLSNPSFETTTFAGTYDYDVLSDILGTARTYAAGGWHAGTSSIAGAGTTATNVASGNGLTPSNGSRMAKLTATSANEESWNFAGFTQTLTGAQYRALSGELSFDVAGTDAASAQFELEVAFFDGSGNLISAAGSDQAEGQPSRFRIYGSGTQPGSSAILSAWPGSYAWASKSTTSFRTIADGFLNAGKTVNDIATVVLEFRLRPYLGTGTATIYLDNVSLK